MSTALANKPSTLPAVIKADAGPPSVGDHAIAIEVGSLGGLCRRSLTPKQIAGANPVETEQLARDLDGVRIWAIWDELPRPATAEQLLHVRLELRNAQSAPANVHLLCAEATLPAAGVTEQACICFLDVRFDLTNGRSIDMGGDMKATGLTADYALKVSAREPGVYPLPGTQAATQP